MVRAVIRIDFEVPARAETRDCCGGKTTSLPRFVYEDDDAHAIYYARFSDKHPYRVVVATVSLGEWGEGSTPDQRVAFAVNIWSDASNCKVHLIDAVESPWRHVDTIGRTLDRDEALRHPFLEEVFHITDHMVRDDQAIKDYLDG